MSAKLHFKEPRSGFKRLRSVGTNAAQEGARGEKTGDEMREAPSPSLVRRLYNRYAQVCVAWGTLTILVLLARAA
jgi:hypothetical protein